MRVSPSRVASMYLQAGLSPEQQRSLSDFVAQLRTNLDSPQYGQVKIDLSFSPEEKKRPISKSITLVRVSASYPDSGHPDLLLQVGVNLMRNGVFEHSLGVTSKASAVTQILSRQIKTWEQSLSKSRYQADSKEWLSQVVRGLSRMVPDGGKAVGTRLHFESHLIGDARYYRKDSSKGLLPVKWYLEVSLRNDRCPSDGPYQEKVYWQGNFVNPEDPNEAQPFSSAHEGPCVPRLDSDSARSVAQEIASRFVDPRDLEYERILAYQRFHKMDINIT